MKRKILYISGTRADYGLMRPVLFEIDKNPDLELEIVATGMHLMEEFGMTINDLRKDGFHINEIDTVFKEDNQVSMVNFIGDFIKSLNKKLLKIKPDIILLLGDRGEMLGGAIVGAYLGIPVAHLHGGEITSTIDEYARHAITKMSNIHLPATKISAERIIKMGENPDNVFVVGAPGLDNILNRELISPEKIALKYDINLSEPLIMVIQHPVSLEHEDSAFQMEQTLETITELKYQTIIIYPNADAGGREMIKKIKEYENYPFIKTFKSLSSEDYLSLMNIAGVIVGNSSSGIIEAPSFNLPAVNIGSRQKGREQGINVIDIDYNRDQIKKAILNSINDSEFREKVAKGQNPYGDGHTSTRVVNILKNITLDEKLMNKQLNL